MKISLMILIAFSLIWTCCSAKETPEKREPDIRVENVNSSNDESEQISQERDKKAIESVKRMQVKETTGESILLEQWVVKHFPKSAKIEWEVNDCGEQSGNPDQKDFPICVDAYSKIGEEHYSVLYAVGSYKLGLTGETELWGVSVKKNGKSEWGNRLEEFDQLVASFDKK